MRDLAGSFLYGDLEGNATFIFGENGWSLDAAKDTGWGLFKYLDIGIKSSFSSRKIRRVTVFLIFLKRRML